MKQGSADSSAKYSAASSTVRSEKTDERIHIGDNVVVTVLEIRGKKVRIGIDAPKEIQVLRSELLYESAEPLSELNLPVIGSHNSLAI